MKPTLEMIKPADGCSFACMHFDLEQFESPYHHHPEVEITWILESEGQRLIGDSIETFTEGDIAMIGANLPHQYRNWKNGKARSNVIQFHPQFLGKEFFKTPEFNAIDVLIQRASRGLSFSREVEQIARGKIQQVFDTPSPHQRALQLIDLLMTLATDESSQPIASITYDKPISQQKAERLKKALALLEEKWDQPVSLADVAEVTELHTRSVSRFFKKHLGMSFQDYLLELRIGRAAQLLLETDQAVSAIADACGFRNLSNFNRQFKQHKGKSPRDYRAGN